MAKILQFVKECNSCYLVHSLLNYDNLFAMPLEKKKNKLPGCTCTHRQSTHITLRFKVMSKNSYTPIYILLAYMRSNESQQLTEVLSFVGIGYPRLSSHIDVL